MDLKFIIDISTVVMLFSPVIAGICAFLRSVYIQIKTILKKIERIDAQLSNNGGSSIKDCIDRIELGLAEAVHFKKSWLNYSYAEPAFSTDINGQYNWANIAYAQLIKDDISTLLGDKWITYIHIDDRARVESEWYECVEKKQSFSMEYHITDRDKTHVTKVKCTAYFDTKSGFFGFLTIV